MARRVDDRQWRPSALNPPARRFPHFPKEPCDDCRGRVPYIAARVRYEGCGIPTGGDVAAGVSADSSVARSMHCYVVDGSHRMAAPVPLSLADHNDRHERAQRGDELVADSATILHRLTTFERDIAANWLVLLAERATHTAGESAALECEGAAEATCHAMRAAPRHGRLQTAGLMLLQQVANSDSGARAVLQARATSVIVSLLGLYARAQLDPPPPSEPLLSMRCLILLLTLRIRCGDDAVEVMLENSAVPVILRFCRASHAEAKLAIRLLLGLADARGAAHLLLVERAVPAVLHAVLHSTDDAMLQQAFLLLWALSELPRGRAELVTELAIDPARDSLSRQLQQDGRHELPQTAAVLGLLAELSRQYDGAHRLLHTGEVVPSAIRIAATSNDPGTREPALALLWELNQHVEGRRQLEAASAAGPLPATFELALAQPTRQEALRLLGAMHGNMGEELGLLER